MRFFKNLLFLQVSLLLVGLSLIKGTNGRISGSEQLDDEGKVLLSWIVDEAKSEVTFELEAETNGYIGFGISPQGSMAGGDIFIAGVFPNGTWYSGDYFGIGFKMPTLDAHQDWNLLKANETGNKTFLQFSRALNTCDEEDFPITNDTNRLIWAMGESDEIIYHTAARRGARSVNIISAPNPDVDLKQMETFMVKLDMEMPEVKTAYWCSFHKRPVLQKKHQIVAFEAYLSDKKAASHTHHFVVYNCILPSGLNQTLDQVFGNITADTGYKGDLCFGSDHNLPVPYCQQSLYVWAKGGKQMIFPKDVGYPIGEENPGQQEYYMLEIHYDNPEGLEGVKFETGLKVYYTDQLRPIDAGLLYLGHEHNPSLTVPPNTTDFVVAGHCMSACTQKYFPEGGIKIFNSMLHAHLSGRKLKLRQFRGDVELPWVDFDDHYDFNYQQNKLLSKEVTIMPGDHLIFECTYDSVWKNGEIVTGKLSSRDEMCEMFAFHYPKVEMNLCRSTYSIVQGLADFGIQEFTTANLPDGETYTILKPDSLAGDYEFVLNNKFQNWTKEFKEELERKRRFGDQEGTCIVITKEEDALTQLVKYPENLVEYLPPNVCEKKGGSNNNAFKSFSSCVFIFEMLGLIWIASFKLNIE